jgi:hypothetical protein
MSRNKMPRFVQAAIVVSLLLIVPQIALGQGGFVGPSSGGPATGTLNASQTVLTYNGATYPIVNGKVTFPDCTIYIAASNGYLIPAGTATGCTPGGGGFVGPGTGGPTTGSVSGNTLTYNGATYPLVDGKVTFPDCTIYIAASNGVLIPAGTASGCAPVGGGGGGGGAFVGPATGGPATGSVDASETQLTYNGTTYPLVNGKVTFPDCTIYIALRSGMLIPAGVAAGCTPGGGSGGGGATRTTPTISWANPASVVAGTILGGAQLNATANVSGTFVYSPAAGAALAAGTQTLSATFTPTDTTSYTTATATVTIVVTASGGGGGSGFVGPASGGPSSGTIIGTTLIYNGVVYTLVNGKVQFPDCSLYIAASNGVLIPAGMASPCTPGGTKLTPVVTWPTPAPVASGTSLTAAQLNATATVAGVFVYSPPAGTVPADGTVTLTALFTPTDSATYTSVVTTVSLTVGAAAMALGPSNGGPTSGTSSGGVLTYNGATFNINAAGQVQLPDCKVYLVVANGLYLIYQRDATSCNLSSGGSGGSTGAATLSYLRAASTCSSVGVGPSNGGPATGTLDGTVLTYNGATFSVNVLNQVQLPDCNVYQVSGSSGGTGGGGSTSIPGAGPIQTWSAPKQVVDVGRVSILGIEMAFDTATQRYLIVWRAGTGACGGQDAIWGQFLDSNADPVGSKFYISLGSDCAWAHSGWEPAVAATGDGRFMVTYAVNNLSGAITPYNVVFNLVDYDGGPRVAPPVTLDTNTSHEATAVAWMPRTQQFMVMWSKNGPPRGVKNIYSMAVTRDGGPAQIYQVNDNPDFIDLAQVRIARGSDNNLMVIAWRDSTNSAMAPNGGISYTQVNEGGSPLMNTGNVVGPSSSFYRYPRVAYNPQTQKYFSIYTDYGVPGCDGGPSGGNIMSRSFDLNGTPVESQSSIALSTNRCNGAVGDDQFTELGLAYEPVNNAFVIGARGQDSGAPLPVYRMVTDPSGNIYQSSVNNQPANVSSTSPVPAIVADGTGRVLIAYRPDYTHIYVMFGSR